MWNKFLNWLSGIFDNGDFHPDYVFEEDGLMYVNVKKILGVSDE